MQLVTLFAHVEVLLDAPGGATLTFLTDLPGNAMASRGSATIPATTGRHPYRMTLQGSAKGKLYQVRILPVNGAVVRLYAVKVWARVLGPSPAPWAWYSVPVVETPVEWQAIKLPIELTSEEWQAVKLPIPVTPEDWSAVHLPIPATSEEWQAVKLPIEPTPDQFEALPLPIKPTPVVPDWVQVQVDQ